MLKRGAVLSVSFLALTGAAGAADLSAPPRYVKAPVAMPVGVPEWAGSYVGVQGGFADVRSTFDDIDHAFDGASHSMNKTGGIFGVYGGHNWQSGNLVWGLETDLNVVSAKASQTFGDPVTQTGEVSWMGSFRGRLGVDYMSTLFYVTGGVAYGGVKNSAVSSDDGGASFFDDKTKFGGTAGVGIEHLFSNHVTLRAEARYTNFGSDTVSGTQFEQNYRGKFSNSLWTGMVGLGYKF